MKAADLPEELKFVVDVVADVAQDRNESALDTLVGGVQKLLDSSSSTTREEFLFAISAIETVVRHKISLTKRGSGTPAEIAHICSFCGKDEAEVATLIAGFGGYICNDCVKTCNEVLQNR